jgi:hypothetical protein
MGNSSQQLELIISFNDITKCYKCLSNENLCWFHSESVKTIIIAYTQDMIIKLKQEAHKCSENNSDKFS